MQRKQSRTATSCTDCLARGTAQHHDFQKPSASPAYVSTAIRKPGRITILLFSRSRAIQEVVALAM